jgi:hypothetical protein
VARNGTWLLATLVLGAAAEADEALVERWDKPRRESFAMKDASPQDVVREIRERYGVPVADIALDLPRMDFEAKDVTFFEALDRLAAARGLLLAGRAPATEPIALVRPARPLPTTPVAHVGPSRLSVRSISVLAETRWTTGEPRRTDIEEDIARILRDRGGPERPRVRVGFQWITEPGFEETSLVSWSVHSAVDDCGAEIAVTLRPDLPLAANDCFVAEFEKPSGKARSIAKLEGRLRVALPAREGQAEFAAGEARQWKPLGDARVKVEDVDAADGTVRLAIEGAPCAALKPCMGDLDVNTHDLRVGSRSGGSSLTVTVLAYRADGAEIAGSVTRRWWDVNFPSVTYWIDLDEAPARLALRTTTVALVREAPFSFSDIPLPE